MSNHLKLAFLPNKEEGSNSSQTPFFLLGFFCLDICYLSLFVYSDSYLKETLHVLLLAAITDEFLCVFI